MKAFTIRDAYEQLNNQQKFLLRDSFIKAFNPGANNTYFYKVLKRPLMAEEFIFLAIRLNLLKASHQKELKSIVPNRAIREAVPVAIQYKKIRESNKQRIRKKTQLVAISTG